MVSRQSPSISASKMVDSASIPSVAPTSIVQGTSATLNWETILCYLVEMTQSGEGTRQAGTTNTIESLSLLVSGHSQRIRRYYDGQWKQEVASPTHICLLPHADPDAAYQWAEPSRNLYLGLPTAILAELAADASRIDPKHIEVVEQFLIHDPLIYHIGLALMPIIQTQDQSARLYAESLGLTLVHHILRNYTNIAANDSPTKSCSPQQIERAVDYIQTHFPEDITLRELASAAAMSVSHFSRLFRQFVGTSPYQYLISCRVKRAYELLEQGKLSIADIAHMVGFFDQAHLNRHFQRHYGYSPGLVHKQVSNNVQRER